MDRNQTIGLVLIAVILIVYSLVFRPPSQEEPLEFADTATVEQVNPGTPVQETQPTEIIDQSENASELSSKFGPFATAMQGEEQSFVIETEKAKYTFSNKGGRIQAVDLTEYLTFDKKPLILFDETTAQQALNIVTTKGIIDLNSLYFSTNSSNKTVSANGTTTTWRCAVYAGYAGCYHRSLDVVS